jgi:replicative DNA helicase
MDQYQRVTFISSQFKPLARELDLPIMVLAQLNRGPDQRDDHRPRMSDLRDSGQIEQDADTVLMLYREDYYHQHEPGYVLTETAELIVAKQRNGSQGVVPMSWNGSEMKYYGV